MTPWRPAEYMTVSAGIFLPLASVVTVPRSDTETPETSSPNRKVTARSRRWNFSDSMTSASQKSSIWGRRSTTVTRVPSAANIEAYSMPITPAPTTTMLAGICSIARMPSESTTRRSSNSTCGGRAGRVPVATTILAAVTVWCSPRRSPTTSTACSSTNRAAPPSRSTRLRCSCARITSSSRPMTKLVRASRSWTVMSCLTR